MATKDRLLPPDLLALREASSHAYKRASGHAGGHANSHGNVHATAANDWMDTIDTEAFLQSIQAATPVLAEVHTEPSIAHLDRLANDIIDTITTALAATTKQGSGHGSGQRMVERGMPGSPKGSQAGQGKDSPARRPQKGQEALPERS